LLLLAPRGFPENLQIIPNLPNARSLQVSWDEIERSLRNGIIINYEIRYEPLEDYGGVIGADMVPSVERVIVLENLEENTEYNISVRGYTVVGPGPFTSGITVRTSEGGECKPFL